MTIKTNMLMITAAAFITGSAAFAQDTTTPAPTTPSVQFLLDLFGGDTAPTKADIAAAIEAEGYTVNRIRLDDDGEVRIRFTTEDGVQYRFRLDDGQTRFGASDDGMNSTSDANGEDTSDTSDSNGSSSDDTSDGNGGSSSSGNGGSSGGGNSGSGGGSDD